MRETPHVSSDSSDRPWPGQPGEALRLAERLKLSDEAAALMAPSQDAGQYVAALRDQGLLAEALQVVAQWLPRCEAVWWACRGLRATMPAVEGAAADPALEAAECWAKQPSETHRRAAGATAEAADFETPAALVAQAAFWSEGSMAPAEVAEVPAPPHLAPTAIVSGLQLAAVQGDPQAAVERLERFLAMGLAAAEGKNRIAAATTPATSE